jgi:hypothetical protein
MPRIDLTGQRFGRLVTICATSERAVGGSILWRCRCDCGTNVNASCANLRRGAVASCGCLQRDWTKSGKANFKHGYAHSGAESSEFNIWCTMKARCFNPNSEKFPDYGGRGITVCERWLNSFENFLADMGPRPEGKTLDREQVNGNYEPGNCRWATPKEQRANQRPRSLAA